MKKKNLTALKLNKVEVANLKFNNIIGGISGSPCKGGDTSLDCPSGPSNDDPSHVYTRGIDTYCVTIVC